VGLVDPGESAEPGEAVDLLGPAQRTAPEDSVEVAERIRLAEWARPAEVVFVDAVVWLEDPEYGEPRMPSKVILF
jgi:hypothetical protein